MERLNFVLLRLFKTVSKTGFNCSSCKFCQFWH